MKPSADTRKPYMGTSRSLVLAIDVGTTFSGVSTSYTPLWTLVHCRLSLGLLCHPRAGGNSHDPWCYEVRR